MIERILNQNLILKTCESKRNQVHVVKGTDDSLYVLKKMKDSIARKKEIEILQLLHENGVAVPRVIEIWGEYILLEYLDGETYLERFERMEAVCAPEKEIVEFVTALIDWLVQFYHVTQECYDKKIVLKDVNFRNFIIGKDEIYGIDFELCGEGDIPEELGKIAAFAFLYEPIGTIWKKEFIECFIQKSAQRFCINRQELECTYYNQVEKIKNRRKCRKM